MGIRRHSASWWQGSTNGVRNWIAVVLVAGMVAVVGTMVVVALRPPTTSSAINYTPAPVPSFVTSAPAMPAVFIGDSYTAGANSSATNKRFTSLVSASERWAETNLGVGGTGYIVNESQTPEKSREACGQDYCNAYPEQITAATELNPSVIVVSGGRNNSASDMDDLRESVSAFYTDLRSANPDAKIIATSPIWDARPAPESLSTIADAVQSAATEVGGIYLDLGQPLADHPEYISGDGVHPNDAGHAAIAKAFEAALDITG